MKKGEQTLPNSLNQAAKTRLWPHFRSHGVDRWPHLVGGTPWFTDMPLSLAGFPVSAPRFDETAFDL